MSLALIVGLMIAVAVYWFVTQIRPEQQKTSLVRRALGEGLLEALNERRHAEGLPLLEIDEGLTLVAENKAVHQLTTGRSDEGWEYPSEYTPMFGRSLLMEALITGPLEKLPDRLCRQREVFDGEWIRVGIGAAGESSGQVVVALVLCREAWEPMPEVSAPALALP